MTQRRLRRRRDSTENTAADLKTKIILNHERTSILESINKFNVLYCRGLKYKHLAFFTETANEIKRIKGASMGLTDRCKTAQNLVDRRKN